jgi:hypothetical protein
LEDVLMSVRRTVLQVEELGPRNLLSGSPVMSWDHIVVLDGSLHGRAAAHELTPPDLGVEWSLQGSGSLGGMGDVHVTGNVHGTGNIFSGTATGTLTLDNAGGDVVLSLTEPGLPSFTLPTDFHWTVTGATGIYQNFLNDTGLLHLDLGIPSTTGVTPFTINVGQVTPTPEPPIPQPPIPQPPVPQPPIPQPPVKATGHATEKVAVPDAGIFWSLYGSGTAAGMGAVTVTGSVRGAGFIQTGRAEGTLTLAGANGSSVTLALQGTEQPGFASLPQSFQYHIISSNGKIDLPADGQLSLVLTPDPDAPQLATFTLTISGS